MNNTAGALLGALALVAVTLGGGGLAWGGAERAAPAVIVPVSAPRHLRVAEQLGYGGTLKIQNAPALCGILHAHISTWRPAAD